MTARASVVLDRDGTLLDFYDMFHRFILDLHDEARTQAPSREEILGYAYWTSITSGALRIGDVRVLDRVDEVVLRYMPRGRLYEGAAAALVALRAAGARLALVSSWVGTRQTRELLRAHGVGDCFGHVATRDDLLAAESDLSDAEAKVALARRALEQLGHLPSDRLFVVGDTPADMALGRRLGAVVVGVRTGNGSMLPSAPPDGPDVLLPSVAGLAGLVVPSAKESR